MKPWHRDDIVQALVEHGWTGAKSTPGEAYFEGYRLLFARGAELLEVAFLADVGTGFTGERSLEEAVGRRHGTPTVSLWLHRRRDAKWKRELSRWAGDLSAVSEGQAERPVPNKETGVFYSLSDLAGFWRRSVVLAVDLGIVFVVCGLVMRLVPQAGVPQRFANFGAFGIAWAYLAGLKAGPAGTLGYRLARVRLVTLQGKPAGLGRSTCRFLFLFGGPLNFVFDLLWLTTDANRQTLRDKLSGTYVVRRGASPAGSGVITYSTYFIATMSFLLAEVTRTDARHADRLDAGG